MNVTEQYDKLSDRKDAICKNCGVPIQVNKRASVAKVLCDTCRKVKTTHNDSVKTNILKEVRYCQYCGGIIVNKMHLYIVVTSVDVLQNGKIFVRPLK